MASKVILASLAFAASLLPLAAPAARPPASAEAFIHELYAAYHPGGRPIELTGPRAAIVLAPALLALVEADKRALGGETGALDADPICACRSWSRLEIRRLVITQRRHNRAQADVVFVDARRHGAAIPREVRYDLVRIAGAWKIFDLHERGILSLRQKLMDEIASLRKHAAAHARRAKP